MIVQSHERSRARGKGLSAADRTERMSLSRACGLSRGVRLIVVTAVLIVPLIALLIALAPATTETLNTTDEIKPEARINNPPPENSTPDTSIEIDEPQPVDKGRNYVRHRNPDGSYTIAIASGTVNYYNGKDWEAIDTRIVDISKTEGNRTISGRSPEVLGDEYRYVMEKAGYHAYFPEMLTDAPIRFAVGSHEFSFKTSSVGYAYGERSRTNGENNFINPRSTAANPSGNIITYPNVFTDGIDVDAEYSLYKTGLKEFWILKSKPKLPEDPDVMLGFNTTINYDSDMYIDGKLILPGEERLLTSSEIEFRDKNGETVFRLPRPYALDAKQEHVFCTYEIQKIDGEILLKNLVPWSWLDDSERTYPVRVDASPETLSAGFSVVCVAGTSWDSTLISSGDWHGDTYRTGIDFDTTAIPDTGTTITKVELKLYIDEEATPLNNDVAKMTSSAETYYNANNYSGFNSDVDGNEYLSDSAGFAGTGSYHTVQLLTAAQTDLENQLGANWFSVGFTGTTETNDKYRDGHTYLEANPPQIIVTYTTTAIEAAVSGTITPSATENEIVSGGKTIIIDLNNDTWVAEGTSFNDIRQDIINGLNSSGSDPNGWNNEVRAKQGVTGVVRTDNDTVTITLDAQSGYNITSDETITVTVPASALVTSGDPVVARPTFDITSTGGIGYQVQNILADLSLDTECATVKVTLPSHETIEMIENAGAGCSGEAKEDKVKFTVATTAETDLLTTYFNNGGYASNMTVTCQSSGNEINFKSKSIGGTFKIYLYEANPDTGALIGDALHTHTETVTLNVAHLWTDLTGLEGEISSGNTFAFKMSFTPDDATSSDIETKFGAYGLAGKQLLFNIDETEAAGCDYSYRRSIVIDHTKVGTDNIGTLPATGFPVLIELSGAWLRTTTEDATNGRIENDNGYDIIFKQGSATLYHEIEEYDGSAATGGKLVAWVRIDSLSKEADTTITMYYGNACVTSPTEDPANVWDDNYKGVWHLNDGDSTAADFYQDSSGNNEHGTLTDTDGDSAAASGKISGGMDFAGDNDEDFIEIANFSLYFTDKMTISGWVQPASSSPANYDGFFGIRGNTENDFYILQFQLSTDLECRFRNSEGVARSANVSSAVSGGSWSYVALTYDGDDLISYVDGQSKTTNPDATGSFSANAFPFQIGTTGGHELDGIVDEVRASDKARSADWIKTSFNNQSDTAIGEGKFIKSLGDEMIACKFLYRRPITIDHTNVGIDNSGTLPATGFPVLVSITMGGTEHWLKWSGAHASGHVESELGWDIIFRKLDGQTQLYHEIEEYDGTTGTLVAWVRIDNLSKETDTTIYMYYGNDCITSPTEEPENVWDDNYQGVWHLEEQVTDEETSGTHEDSTGVHDGSQVNNDDYTGEGRYAQTFDGTSDYINIADHDDFSFVSGGTDSAFSVSAWIRGETDRALIVSKDVVAAEYELYLHSDGRLGFELYDPAWDYIGQESIASVSGAWQHVVATYDGSETSAGIKIYIDGVAQALNLKESGTYDGMANTTDNVKIGAYDQVANEYDFNGQIDEVRVSSTVRDADWIRTSYNNQVWPNKAVTPSPDPSPNPPSGFLTVGNEEFNVATAVGLVSFTATGQDSSVLVEWETAQEIDNLGFNLYRSTEVYGTYTKLNRRLIPGLISSVSGQQYSYTDTDVTRSVLYYYMLEDVDLSGTRTMHGPVCVDWDNDGLPDDYYEEEDDDTDAGEEEPEVSIPDSGFDELELDLSDWAPSSSSASWVKLASFRARQEDEGIALEWETSFEVDILGFHVYREVEGKFYRVTADLVPGSVFRVGAGRELPAGQSYGQSYVYWDGLSEGRGDELYWLDSVELNGGRASFGPVRPEIYGQPVAERIRARLRSIGRRQVSRARALGNIRALREELSTKPAKTYKSQVTLVQAVPEKSSGPRLLPGEEQRALAAQPGVKIFVKEDGWYRVGEPELVEAGLSPGVDPRYLQLYADGEEQCLMVTGSDDGRFDPEDAIEFYGTGLDTPFTAAHVYWLVAGSRPGRRLDTPFTDIRLNLGRRLRIPRGLRGRGAPLSFPFSMELKERTFYFAALRSGERENFFGSVISTEPVDQLLTVAHPDPSSPEDALLEVVLQGGTDSTHQVRILFNYVEVGEVVFSGQEQWRAEIEVPHDLLLEGENVVTLTAQGGSMDVSLVDYIRLTYWRTYTADEDALRFRASGGEWLSIGGFSSSEIKVRDITDPMRIFNVRGKVMEQDSGYAITVKVPGNGERSLMAFTGDKIKSPAGIAANLVSSWHELSQGAEVIIIGHSDLLGDVRFLKELREQQGWSVALVDVEDLYDEFNFGAKSPWALKDFLGRAYLYWNPQPRFVVLVGDASYDPRDYLGFGEFDLVPTKFVDTEYLKTASDDWFVDFNNDELPEMALGRLPVESAEEASAVVSKIISYEDASGLMNEALLVADINDFFNFEGASEEVGNLFPGDMTVSEIFRDKSPTARSDLLDSLNQGQLLVNYIGHGSAKTWKGDLLTSLDAWNLTNSPYLPFLVSMTCLNGFFQDPSSESMAETFLKAELGGAVAVWSSSGLTDPEGQLVMNKELIRLLFNGQGLTIGAAVMRAKQVVTDADIRKTWILLGDPTLRLR
jgi:hypothetical protein